MTVEVVTFGEAMIRLTPPHFKRLEQADSLDVEIGGAELNTAVGLARLGRSVAWVSRLTDNPLGRLIASKARAAGVSTEHICFTDSDRVGVYFLEVGAAPRPSSIVYDRANSAMARIEPGMIDWPTVFLGAKWFQVTGITAGLSATSARATHEALEAARAAGVTVSVDLNYRAKLWSLEDAGRWLKDAVQQTDVLITTPDDVERFFDVPRDNVEEAGRQMCERFDLKAVAFTLRESESVWRNRFTAVAFGGGRFCRTRTYDVEIVDRLGAGDAFASGLIHGLLDGDLQKGLDYGTAMGAVKHSIPGDFLWMTAAEVEAVMQGGSVRINR
jgi:2-dehydro-3-deoxygluconokinase